MKKPNFFIIGAPKCGTTSLAAWLAEHRQIYMSTPKEPHFFNSDYRLTGIRKLDKYENLFHDATKDHLAVGEASVLYLLSDDAILNILEYNDTSKFIVCIRNPVEMALSLHGQLVFSDDEKIVSFEAAWHKHRGEWGQREKYKLTDYGPTCQLGWQIERLFTRVLPDNIHVVVMDDLRIDARKEYLTVLKFLGIKDDGKVHFPVLNTAKKRIFPIINQAAMLAGKVKRGLGIEKGFGLLDAVGRINTCVQPRQKISDTFEQELKDYFREDVRLLSNRLQRDLTYWCD